ncbi:hypothetical protein KKE33_04805 [Patescibacteria group bacterium]|nr:hypothetical protein [Patescibacteria group bacterium]
MNKLFLLIIPVLFLMGCSSQEDWTGFYYPDADNIGDESSWVIQPGFESLEECRDWVNDVSVGNHNFDYECGYDCRYNKDFGASICKKTEQ